MYSLLSPIYVSASSGTDTVSILKSDIGTCTFNLIKIELLLQQREDLQEIESMQLVAQFIMVIVCTIIAFIVLYYCCKKFRHAHTLFKYCFPFPLF